MKLYFKNPLRFIMLILFYPAFLGTLIWQVFDKIILVMLSTIENGGAIAQYFCITNIIRIIIMMAILTHFIVDYIFLVTRLDDENKENINYDYCLFIIDIFVIGAFPIAMTSLRLNNSMFNKYINPYMFFAWIYLLYSFWTLRVVFVRKDVIKKYMKMMKRFIFLFLLFLIFAMTFIFIYPVCETNHFIFIIFNLFYVIPLGAALYHLCSMNRIRT